MKIISFVGVLFFFATNSYSQSEYFKDTSVNFTSNPITISYSPSGLISKIQISAIKFKNNKQGILFSFVSIKKEKPSIIRIDSISFKLNNTKILNLSHPYRDTIFYIKDGSLSLNIIYELDKSEITLLKQENINTIILPVDKMQYYLELKKTSRQKLGEFIKLNY